MTKRLGKTYSMRSKEDADDYRYFPDPDLVPIELSEEYVEQVKKTIPRLPDERKAAYMEQYGLKAADAENLVSEREIADAFEAAAKQTKDARTLAHLILSEGFRLLGAGETQIPIAPEHLDKAGGSFGGRAHQQRHRQEAVRPALGAGRRSSGTGRGTKPLADQ